MFARVFPQNNKFCLIWPREFYIFAVAAGGGREVDSILNMNL